MSLFPSRDKNHVSMPPRESESRTSCTHPYNRVVVVNRYTNKDGFTVNVMQCMDCKQTWEEEVRHR